MFKQGLVFILLVCVLFTACSMINNNDSKSVLPELRLVSVGSDVFSKPTAPTATDIAFGDVLATEKLYYLIENTGEIPVFNVRLTTTEENIEIKPNTIGVINPDGAVISTTPIISMTCPHVIPPSGVGSLLPMQLGLVEDSLNINYQFVAPFDSIGVWEEGDTIDVQSAVYSISANKKGIVLEPYYHNELVWESREVRDFHFSITADDYAYTRIDNSDSLHYIKIINVGNEDIDYEMFVRSRFQDYTGHSEYDTLIIDGTLNINDSLNFGIIDILRPSVNDTIITDTSIVYKQYDITYRSISAEFSPTQYIMSVKDKSFINGILIMRITAYFDR